MPLAFCDFFSCNGNIHRNPFGDDAEIRFDLQQLLQYQGPGFGDGLFHREDADKVVPDLEMVALCLDI